MTLRPSVALAAIAASFCVGACSGGGASEPTSVPTTLSASVTPAATAPVGTAVSPVPLVRVTDQNAQPVKGVTVTFIVTGGGLVTASTASTSDSGTASPGAWTLGSVAGLNTLTASVANLTPVMFRVTGTSADPCATGFGTLTINSSVVGALTTASCRLTAGEYTDFYALSVPTAQALLLTQTSAVIDSYVSLFTSNSRPVAENDDTDSTTFNSSVKVLVNPGSFTVGASTSGINSTGPYTLTASSTTSTVANCEQVFLMRGVTTNQAISATDCVDETGPYYEDFYMVYLDAGVPVTIDETSVALDSYLELYLPSGQFLTFNDDRDTTTLDARISFTPATAGYFFVGAETFDASATGPYTLTVQQASSALTADRVLTPSGARLRATMNQLRMAPVKNWRATIRAILSAPPASRRRRPPGPKPPG